MIFSISFRRKLKRIWKEWLMIPLTLGLVVFGTVFIILTKTLESNYKNERLAELPEWPRGQSVRVKDYMNFTDSFLVEPHTQSDVPPPFCGYNDIALIIVTTSPDNFVARKMIRSTWGSRKHLEHLGVKIAFVMGRSNNFETEALLNKEATEFNDIIQDNFNDSFHNQTLKSLSMLRWVKLTCKAVIEKRKNSLPHWIVKVRDDAFLNVNRLLKLAKDMPYATMIGERKCGQAPKKDVKSKYYIPRYLYEWSRYPAYMCGCAYMLKSEIVSQLLENTDATPLIPLEDIYVTGLLARRSYFFPDDSSAFHQLSFQADVGHCEVQEKVVFSEVKPLEVPDMWEFFQNQEQKSCPKLKSIATEGGRYLRMSEKQRKLCMIPKAREKYYTDHTDEDNPDFYDGYGFFPV